MNINLKPYQEKAVGDLVKSVSDLIARQELDRVCVFQAPTGSGKTVMTARFIEEIIKTLPEADLCFLWMSIGTGDLHMQSKRSLERMFEGFPKVSLVEDEFAGARNQIDRNEVVVASWEKLRTKNAVTGDWDNTLMRDGELPSFRTVLSETRERRNIILIIDESHIGAAAERTTELREEIGATVTLEMSATPRLLPEQRDIARGAAGFVYVDPADVIAEGMIKKELIINEKIDEIAESADDSQRVVLEAAYQKRLQLKQLFESVGSSVNPLVLVQIPTAEAGTDKLRATVHFLAEKGPTEGNGRLAIWLNEQKSDTLDLVSLPGNAIEFLIFKQAISTGWDCPRAHILVKFRESRSETFEIQTVGRILRMPELKHYETEELNRGYIYTNVQDIIVKKEEYNPNIIKHIKSTRIGQYEPIKLQSYYRHRADYGDVRANFAPVFESAANDYFDINGDSLVLENIERLKLRGVLLDDATYHQDIALNANVEAKSFDQTEGSVESHDTVALRIAGNDLQALFEQLIKECLGPFKNVKRSVPAVKAAVYTWFEKCLGYKSWDDKTQSVLVASVRDENRPILKAVLMSAIERYKPVKDLELARREASTEEVSTFDVPVESYFNEYTDECVTSKNYVHDPCYLRVDRSSPEKQFEAFLNSTAKHVAWWWKNGESSKDYFGIKYEYPVGTVCTFYPDYIVLLTDGRLCIFEVKDMRDQGGPGPTKAKAEQLYKYVGENSSKHLFGGIAIQRNNMWLLNTMRTYDWQKYLQGDWSDWTPLSLGTGAVGRQSDIH